MNEAERAVPAPESAESEHVGDYLRRLVDGHDGAAITLHTADVKKLLDCWQHQAVTIELYQSEKGSCARDERQPVHDVRQRRAVRPDRGRTGRGI